MTPRSVPDYVRDKLSALPDIARLAVIFDPRAGLDWSDLDQLEDERARSWSILRYDGNDLAFRRARRDGRTVVWVTANAMDAQAPQPNITLRSLMDVWSRADVLLDASLVGVVRSLAPTETWPVASLWEYADILGQDLPEVLNGLRDIRRHAPPPAALEASSIRALALHCLAPDIPASTFLFQLDTPDAVLQAYLELLWRRKWDAAGVSLLRKQAFQAPRIPLQDVQAWLDVPPDQLAIYVYFRRLLGLFGVQNVANQLRGLGIIDIPIERLELHVGRLLERWNREESWRTQIIEHAEAALHEDDVLRAIGLLEHGTPEAVLDSLARVETPAALYALQAEFISSGVQNAEFHRITPLWNEHRNRLLAKLPATRFAAQVQVLTEILDDIAFVDSRRSLSIPAERDLASLLDWYVAERLYDLEYANSRAESGSQRAPERLRTGLKQYLKSQKEWVKTFLDELDHVLGGFIQANWGSYANHPRLATNVLWDTVKKRRMIPSEQSRLWVVVFDGMRWDTWVRHLRPRLLEHFELVEAEKPYLSLLPSWTAVARTGLLAGKTPGNWRNSSGGFSKNQADLAAKLFDIPPHDRSRRLVFYSGAESDRKLDQVLGGGRYPYNILVYNISDDNLHGIKGSLVELNKVVDTLLDNIVQALTTFVEPDDRVVVSSDHGFYELGESDAIRVKDDNRWQRQIDGDPNPIRYRYITSQTLAADFEQQYAKDICKVGYPGFNDHFTVSIGRKWFRRADARGPEDRYAHGGLSFAEMTVPGAVLKRITQRRIRPEIAFEPAAVSVLEGSTVAVLARIKNKGNAELRGQLTVTPEPIGDTVSFPVTLLPGDTQTQSIEVKGHYRILPNKQAESTRFLRIAITFKDLDGKEKTKSHRVSVTVSPRTDKVEIDLGALDNLDV